MTAQAENTEKQPFILFELAGLCYGIHSGFVQQIVMVESITPVPNTPAYIQGVIFSRGQVIPLINLRVKLGFPGIEVDFRTRVIVIRYNERVFGLLVDSAREYVNLSGNIFQPLPDNIKYSEGTYLESIAKTEDRVILIFNVLSLLEKNENKMFNT